MKRSIKEWLSHELYQNILIDVRQNFENSLDELITRDEFENRLRRTSRIFHDVETDDK